MKSKTLYLMAGILIGAAIAGPTAQAAENWLKALPSAQTFYVDDQRVTLEAYAIGGYNYVKLRDIGQAVGFNVCYDPDRNAAIIEPDKPYTGEDVGTAEPTPTSKPSASVDYAHQANPAVFTGELTREIYNAIRDTVVNREAILTGNANPQGIPWTGSAYKVLDTVTAAMGNYPAYEAVSIGSGELACEVNYPEAYAQAVAHTQPLIDSLTDLGQRERVERIAWYVCDRMTYSTKLASPTVILASNGVTAGNCMSYAHSFLFLCCRADIPCILLCSETHEWNRVYVDGQWWDVDLTATDVGNDTSYRSEQIILHDSTYYQGNSHADADPDVTAFVMEVLAPGSTR